VGEPFKGKKVLITGGAGFIGSNLARGVVENEAEVTIANSFIPEYGANLSIRKDLGWHATVSLGDGTKRTPDYFRSRTGEYV
jgi:nucleoside-diphosphate-sugar epimerase